MPPLEYYLTFSNMPASTSFSLCDTFIITASSSFQNAFFCVLMATYLQGVGANNGPYIVRQHYLHRHHPIRSIWCCAKMEWGRRRHGHCRPISSGSPIGVTAIRIDGDKWNKEKTILAMKKNTHTPKNILINDAILAQPYTVSGRIKHSHI